MLTPPEVTVRREKLVLDFGEGSVHLDLLLSITENDARRQVHGRVGSMVTSHLEKFRHTTTRRQLHFTADGCAVLDTPGMRELQLTDVEAGIADVFADTVDLADQCRFSDCRHDTEPGCAIQSALERGEVDADRLARWHKLATEERFNASSLAERKTTEKSRQKMINSVQQKNRR